MSASLDAAALDQLFLTARTHNGWRPEPLAPALLQQVYDLAKWGPTAANTTPARFVFVTSDEGRAQLAAVASGNNQAKILAAPCTVVIGHDLDFIDAHPRLWPSAPDMLAGLKGTPAAETLAFRGSSMQGAYLIVAARALGLDCGPMGGFDNAAVDDIFFAGTNIKSNFICSLGHGVGQVYPRNPRLAFEEACRFA